ncbi:DUF3119 family protein [Oscillatoria salina]|uniref:DUF3119 family protein n=1 Tax=Oscillatoria salina TaxID=331517 RepID=UPI0021E329A0|nr:DUF3119 family protein [Oscillatoria salina]MBZ8182662.1 DUF3119 family protein [Oscillatoria salina IIICB1]
MVSKYKANRAKEVFISVTIAESSTVTEKTIELSPSYRIPLVLVVVSIPLLLVQPWVAFAIAVFGLFLSFQTVSIRLKFTDSALDVYRSEKLIRHFPYSEWMNWRIFFPKVPILFYFREVNSIHFLPIIFDAKMLKTCLEKYCPYQE